MIDGARQRSRAGNALSNSRQRRRYRSTGFESQAQPAIIRHRHGRELDGSGAGMRPARLIGLCVQARRLIADDFRRHIDQADESILTFLPGSIDNGPICFVNSSMES